MSTLNYYMTGLDWTESQREAEVSWKHNPRVFVYGTLKSGYGNNTLLSTSRLIGKAVTKKHYVLGNVGFPFAFPADVVPAGNQRLLHPVAGEVWEIDTPGTLLDLDNLEGHPTWYKRREVELQDDSLVWIYEMDDFERAAPRCSACHLSDEGVWTWRSN